MIQRVITAEEIRPGMTVLPDGRTYPILVDRIELRQHRGTDENAGIWVALNGDYANTLRPDHAVKVVTHRPDQPQVTWHAPRDSWVVVVTCDGPVELLVNGEPR